MMPVHKGAARSYYPRRAHNELVAAWEHLRSAARHGAWQLGHTSQTRGALARGRATAVVRSRGPWRWLATGLATGLAAGAAVGLVAGAAAANALARAAASRSGSAAGSTDDAVPHATDPVGTPASTATGAVRDRARAAVQGAAATARGGAGKVRDRLNRAPDDGDGPAGPPPAAGPDEPPR